MNFICLQSFLYNLYVLSSDLAGIHEAVVQYSCIFGTKSTPRAHSELVFFARSTPQQHCQCALQTAHQSEHWLWKESMQSSRTRACLTPHQEIDAPGFGQASASIMLALMTFCLIHPYRNGDWGQCYTTGQDQNLNASEIVNSKFNTKFVTIELAQTYSIYWI